MASDGGPDPGREAAGTPGGAPDAAPLLSLRGVGKSFGGLAALRDVDLDLYPGEAHALVGENGAGKSTLVKILAGVHQPDAGTLSLAGAPLVLPGPAAARAAGIAVIHQEPTLFPDLSVAENVLIGHPPAGRFGLVDTRAMRRRAAELFARLGVRIDPARPARGLSIADQQLVEVAKALSFEARVLVMDEPTAALSGVEVERLFTVTRALFEHGTAVLFISHRFEEVFGLCRRITVLRDGAGVSHDLTEQVGVAEVIRRMVGRDVAALFPKQDVRPGETVLEVTGLTRPGVFSDVTFGVRRGEIVALAGLVGAGRSEVVRAVFGIDRYAAGQVRVAGRVLPPGRPPVAIAAGLALVPEDRRQQGLVMEQSVLANVTLTRRRALARFGLSDPAAERRSAGEWRDKLRIKAGRLSDPVSTLSGGNQQKVVLAKWLATTPAVLIVDEPTRGVDIATKAEVHRLLSGLAAEGMAVLMVSSELPEVLGMADRVLVMHEGRLVADLPRERADEESVLSAATGQRIGPDR